MEHWIHATPEGLRITANVQGEQRAALAAELARCAAGTCSCPSPQYDKLSSVEVREQPEGLAVDLKVKPGEEVDAADIARCLDHTSRALGLD